MKPNTPKEQSINRHHNGMSRIAPDTNAFAAVLRRRQSAIGAAYL